MLLLAIPGMIGEAVVLSHLSTFMPRIHASSGGRYGAFLFATYALVLGIAEVVTLRATGNALAELKTTTQRIASSQVTGNPEVSFITINVVKFSR
jgi:hypothetical protein